MWEMEGKTKATMKKEMKETTTEKANCCASPGIYKEPSVLSAKATLPTYCDGNVGISLLLDGLFSQLKKFTKDFFFSTVLLLRNSMFMQGKMYFLKSLFHQRDANGELGTA